MAGGGTDFSANMADKMPWVLDLQSHLRSYSRDQEGDIEEYKEGYGQKKAAPFANIGCGNLIPSISVQYKAGLPISISLYNPIQCHKQLVEAQQNTGRPFPFSSKNSENYKPIITYAIHDANLQQEIKQRSESKDKENQLRIDTLSILEMLNRAEIHTAPVEVNKIGNVFNKFIRNAKEFVGLAPSMPLLTKHYVQSDRVLEYK